MNEWLRFKSFVPEEFDAYNEQVDKRLIYGAAGKSVTKIKRHPSENQTLKDMEE